MKTNRTAWLFPGQGSQFIGMGRELIAEFPPAADFLALASEIAGADLRQIVTRGPDALLTRTDHLQPALTAINLGCSLRLERLGLAPAAVAGHSLGEFSALFAAGVLTAEETLKLVTERGRLMHDIARTLDGGMLAVKGLRIETVVSVLATLSRGDELGLANHNAPEQIVISGDNAGLGRAAAALGALGGRTLMLNVSGPWHSQILRPAAKRFAQSLACVHFRDARFPVVMNVNGQALVSGEKIYAAMMDQLCSPVRWVQVQRTLFELGSRRFVEVGPGKVLRGLVRALPELVDCEIVSFDGPRAFRFLEESALKKGVA